MRLTSAAEQRSQGVSTAVATGVAAFALVAGTTVPPSTNGLSIGHLTMVAAAGLLALRARRRTIVIVGSIAAVAASTILAPQHGLVTAAITSLLVVVLTMAAVDLADRVGRSQASAIDEADGSTRNGLHTLLGHDLGGRDLLAIEASVVETTRAILHNRDMGEVQAALAGLVRSVGCDVMVVCRNSGPGDSPTTRIVHLAGDHSRVTDPTEWRHVPHAARTLSSGRLHGFSSTDEMPPSGGIGYEERITGVSAAVELPIVIGDRWVGHVGLFATDRTHTWEEAHLDLLTTIADTFAWAWERQDAVADLEEVLAERDRSLAIQTAITGSARLLFDSGDDDIETALDLILTALDCESVYVRDVKAGGPDGVGFTTTTVAVAGGAHPGRALQEGAWTSWPPAYQPILECEPWVVTSVDELGLRDRRWYAEHLSGTVSEVAFPIVTGSTVVGMVGVTDGVPREWGPADIGTVATLAQLLGVARTRSLARRTLEDVVRAKDRFIASVSHELRTPMAVVMGLSSELNTRRQAFTEEEVGEFIELISRQSSEVGNIIEDLLVSARASAASITVLPEMIRLDQVVSDVLGAMSAEHTRRITSVELEEVSTFADPLRVRQIVRNLVANGHRHGGASVFIRVAEREGSAVLEVSDDGPGIPPGRRDEIFEAYAGGETEGRPASIGLGLTVSRQLALLMGGDVTYVHHPLTTFRLTLPVGVRRGGTVDTTQVATGRTSPSHQPNGDARHEVGTYGR